MKFNDRQHAILLGALRYFGANLDDVNALNEEEPMEHFTLDSNPITETEIDKLCDKLNGIREFKRGDKVTVMPLNLPNGERAPNRNFEEPFIGKITRVLYIEEDSEASYLVEDKDRRNFCVEEDQLSIFKEHYER